MQCFLNAIYFSNIFRLSNSSKALSALTLQGSLLNSLDFYRSYIQIPLYREIKQFNLFHILFFIFPI